MTVHWYFNTSPDGDASNKNRYAGAHVTVAMKCPPVDSIMDSLSVRDSIASAWRQSNYSPGSDQTTRWEKGGWIVRGSDGRLSVIAFTWPSENCALDAPGGTVPPPGAIAWFHTHPWTKDEKMTTCPPVDFTKSNNPLLQHLGVMPQTYGDHADDFDQAASGAWGNLPGYIIDGDGISRFDSTTDVRISNARCGY